MAKMAKAKKAAAPAARKATLAKPKNSTQYTQSEFYDCFREFGCLENRKQSKSVYSGFCDMIHAALKKGFKVVLPGIGKLQVRQTKARMGRNPKTGEMIKISAKKRIRLTPSKAFKEAVL